MSNVVHRAGSRHALEPVVASRRRARPLFFSLIGRHLDRLERFVRHEVAYFQAIGAATARRFGVRSLPTLLALKGGREVDRIVGVRPKAEIARRLEKLIA